MISSKINFSLTVLNLGVNLAFVVSPAIAYSSYDALECSIEFDQNFDALRTACSNNLDLFAIELDPPLPKDNQKCGIND